MRGILAGAASCLAVSAVWAHSGTETATPAPTSREFEGALGLVLNRAPAFPGANVSAPAPELAGFVRWGRITLSGAGGFTTRRSDEVDRGLGAQWISRGDLRLSVGLRLDRGRMQSASPALAGMGDIPLTVRARMTARWTPRPDWQLAVGVAGDPFKRAGGMTAEASLQHDWTLGTGQHLLLGVGISAANASYMQTWHGVSFAQSQRSGYAQYTPGGGLRGASVSVTYRHEFDNRWAAYASISPSRILGPAARSPLTGQTVLAAWQLGVARRF